MTTIQQPEALRIAEDLEKLNMVFSSEIATELRRLHEVNAELLRLVKLVHGSFGGGRVMTFSEADVEDFDAAITKATGETE